MRAGLWIACVAVSLVASCTRSSTPPVAAPLPTLSPTSAGPDPCANPYLPVKAGDAWYYRIDVGSVHDTYADTVTTVSEGSFIITSNYTLVAQNTTWSCGSDGLTSLHLAGGAAATVSTMATGTSISTDHAKGLTLPANPAPGDRWAQSFDLSGSGLARFSGTVRYHFQALRMDRVATPAGHYRALLVHVHGEIEITGTGKDARPVRITTITAQWWARGVGLVRQDAEVHVDGGTSRVVQELTRFETG
jgi:hypothetical protein